MIPCAPKSIVGLDRLLHRAAEADAALDLQGDVFRDELGVEFRGLDFLDVDLDLTCPRDIFEISSVIFSISAPLRPITMPGRAVWMVTRMLFQARSMTILETAASRSFFFT